jgi:hypothetical protein
LALLPLPATALERNVALGSSGEVYLAREGTYGSLFSQGQEAPAANPVLAVEITRPGGETERLLVPGTEGRDEDRSPALVFEPGSSTLFVLWEHRVNAVQSVLALASFDGTRWERALQISSNPFSAKMAPQLTVTRDTYQDVDSDNKPITRHRTILQLLWEEENLQGGFDVFYSPLILEDGVYLGSNPVYNLSALVGSELIATQTAGDAEPPAALVNSPIIQRGRDSRTALIAFVSASSRRLVTIEADLLPEELGRLAEKIRMNIIDIGAQQSDRASLARSIKEAVLSEVASFEPEVLSYLASQVHDLIVASGDQPVEALGHKIRMNIIDIGARLSGRGLRSAAGSAKSEEIARPSLEDLAPHWIQLRTGSSWPSPNVGTGQIRLFASEAGSDVLVSWSKANRIFYRQSTADGWTGIKEIQLSESVSLEKAYELLESKVRNR